MLNVAPGAAGRLIEGTALVLLSLPGMLLFYGSQGRGRDTSPTMSRLFLVGPILALQWMFVGAALVLERSSPAYATFQTACALVAAGILMCAIRARIKTSATIALVVLWSTLVYDPIAYWMCRGSGWPWSLGAVVQLVGSGSALVCARFLDREAGRFDEETCDRSKSRLGGMALLSASALAVTIGGSPLAVGFSAPAGEFFVLTAVGSGVAWVIGGWRMQSSPSSSVVGNAGAIVGLVVLSAAGGRLTPLTPVTIGFVASSAYRGMPSRSAAATMAGLLAITEATSSGNMPRLTALAIALATGTICYAAVHLRRRLGNGRRFNQFGLHVLGGAMGVPLAAIAATRSGAGVLGGPRQFTLFVLACAAAAGYSACATHVLLRLVKASIRLRAPDEKAPRCVTGDALGMLPPQTGR